jgi:hypothetical protein
MKTLFLSAVLVLAAGALAGAAPPAPADQPPTPATSQQATAIGTPPWLAASTFCSGDCDVYCGSGAVEKYYEPAAACCSRYSCLDGSGFLFATWHPPSGCWGGGECAPVDPPI